MDFLLLRVGLGSVTVTVVVPPGTDPAGAHVRLRPVDGPELGMGGLSGWMPAGVAVTLDRVPPGRYVLSAAGGVGTGGAVFGRQVVDVEGAALDGLSVVLTRGTTVSGRVRFEGAEPTWRDVTDLQVVTALQEFGSGAREVRTAIAARDGAFTLRDLRPGPRRFGLAGLGETRVLERITMNGREITDRAVTLGGGVRIAGLEIVVTDRVSTLRGMVRGGRDGSGDRSMVVVFSTDPERWFPTSRYVQRDRPGRDGRYSIRGVPPGDYWVAAAPLSAVGAEEWRAPRWLDRLRTGATRVSVRKGDTVDVDVRARGR